MKALNLKIQVHEYRMCVAVGYSSVAEHSYSKCRSLGSVLTTNKHVHLAHTAHLQTYMTAHTHKM